MKRRYVIVLTVLILLLNCDKSPQPESEKLQVASSIMPLADFVQKIGASRVEVFTIVPPGADPHSFELTPGLMRRLTTTDLLVFNGIGLEFWLDDVLDNLQGKTAVFAAKGLDVLHDHEHHHVEGNPHVWLDPQHAIYQVKRIYAAMADVDPENRPYYEHNAAVFVKELEVLHEDIQATVDTWQQKQFVCFHPAWEYFAERYGLHMAAVIQERPGSEPSPKDIQEIINTVERIGAKAIFVEAQFPSRVAEMIAEETGINVVPLDPLGGSQGMTSYVELMRYNVAQMNNVMRE